MNDAMRICQFAFKAVLFSELTIDIFPKNMTIIDFEFLNCDKRDIDLDGTQLTNDYGRSTCDTDAPACHKVAKWPRFLTVNMVTNELLSKLSLLFFWKKQRWLHDLRLIYSKKQKPSEFDHPAACEFRYTLIFYFNLEKTTSKNKIHQPDLIFD